MTQLPFFTLAVLALLAVPGPTNVLLFVSGAASGIWLSLKLIPAALAGYLAAIGGLMMIGGPVIATIPWVGIALRVLLVAYTLYLAWRLWSGEESEGTVDALRAPVVTARQVFLTTLLNPKGLVLAFAVFPSVGEFEDLAIHLTIFALLVPVIATPWVLLGATARSGLTRLAHPRVIPRLSALVLAGIASLLAGSTLTTLLT